MASTSPSPYFVVRILSPTVKSGGSPFGTGRGGACLGANAFVVEICCDVTVDFWGRLWGMKPWDATDLSEAKDGLDWKLATDCRVSLGFP